MLTVIVKGTNGCNLACSYCSLGEKNDFKFIDREHLEALFIYSCELAKYRKQDSVNFILHGGEPTLVDADIYEACIRNLKIKYPKLHIRISMQSNGLVMSDRFVELIKNNDIHVGISLDGSEEIHDLERRTRTNQSSFAAVTGNIEKLLQAGIPVSCLMVLTKHALHKGFGYLDYFEGKGIPLKINPLLNYGEVSGHPELMLASGDYAEYLIDLYEYIMERQMDVVISPIDNILNGVIYQREIRECSFRKECSRDFLCIDYKGDIYPCGKFSDMDRLCIGNIADTSFAAVDDFLEKNLYERRSTKLPNTCLSCKYLDLCNGGCSAEALIDGDFHEPPVLCEDYKILFQYFRGDGLRLLRRELVKQKQALEERL